MPRTYTDFVATYKRTIPIPGCRYMQGIILDDPTWDKKIEDITIGDLIDLMDMNVIPIPHDMDTLISKLEAYQNLMAKAPRIADWMEWMRKPESQEWKEWLELDAYFDQFKMRNRIKCCQRLVDMYNEYIAHDASCTRFKN